MKETHHLQSKDERAEVFGILNEIKEYTDLLASCSRPMFNGKRFLSDSELARRLSVSKTTLANYRLKGILGFYSLEGKIIYAEDEVDTYLCDNYHPQFK